MIIKTWLISVSALIMATTAVTGFANDSSERNSKLVYLNATSESNADLPCNRPSSVNLTVLALDQSFELDVDSGGCFPVINVIRGQAIQKHSNDPDTFKIDLLAESGGVLGNRLLQPVTLGTAFVDTSTETIIIKTISSLYAGPAVPIDRDQDNLRLGTTELIARDIRIRSN